MAETLGVVASSMAVVSLAIQLAENIEKLKEFCQVVREAPDTVMRAIDELETLSLVLEDVDRSMQEQVFLNPRVKLVVLKSYRLCRSSGDAVQAIIVELEQSLVRGKRRGALKIALKKDQLQELGAKLDSAKSTLLLANQIYYQAVQAQRWESLEEDISQLREFQRQHHSDIKIQVIENQTTRENADNSEQKIPRSACQRPCKVQKHQRTSNRVTAAKYMAGILELVTFQYGSSKMTNLSFNLPRWIYARRLDLSLKRSYQGWDSSFRVYKRVPYEARVFDYCIKGDVKSLQRLFQAGESSPFEVDPDGLTPLHYAAVSACPNACRFLLDNGADANTPTSLVQYDDARGDMRYESLGLINYSTPLHLLVGLGHKFFAPGDESYNEYYQATALQKENFHETLRVLVEIGVSDLFQEDGGSYTIFDAYDGPEESFRWLCDHEEVVISTLETNEMLKIAANQMGRPGNMKIARHWLPAGYLEKNMKEVNKLGGLYRPLPRLLMLWTEYYLSLLSERRPQETGALEELISEHIIAESDLHFLKQERGESIKYTPLLTMIRRTVLFLKGLDRRILMSWLSIIIRAGYDLVQYGQTEIDMQKDGTSNWQFCDPSDPVPFIFEIRKLNFGPAPEDWDIEFEDLWVSSSLCADFWSWVEDPEGEDEKEDETCQAIPGSWIED